MKSAVGSSHFLAKLSACVTLFSLIVTVDQTVLRRNQEGDRVIYPDTYLNSFGYLGQRHHALPHTRADVRQAIKSYQEHTGIKVSGKMDRTTWELMKKPRCGVPDVTSLAGATRGDAGRVWRHKRRAGNETSSKKNIANTAKPLSSNKTGQDPTWHNHEIGYLTTRYTTHIPVDKQKSIFQESFLRWSKPSKIRIQTKIDSPEILITFARREHGDGDYNSFDGRGMLLAHAYSPGNASMSGDIHFDMDELWSTGVNKSDTRDLMMIAMHEVGHSVGLQHSKNKNDIMYPVYLDYNPDPQLNIGDIKKLQQLYGKRPGFVSSPRKRGVAKMKPVQKLPDKLLPKWCHQRFDSVVLGPGEVASIFTGSQVYCINNDGVMPGYPVHIGHEFPRAPTNPAAVFYVRDVRKTYFFKDTRIWRFTNTTLDVGYPKESKTRFLETPRAALATTDSYGRSMVLFFGKKFTWRWNFDSEEVNGHYRAIATVWRGLPANIDAVVEWTDHYIYFFKGKKYYKANKNQKVVLANYPRHVGPAWLGGVCGHAPK